MQGKGKPCQFAEKSEARENNGERGPGGWNLPAVGKRMAERLRE